MQQGGGGGISEITFGNENQRLCPLASLYIMATPKMAPASKMAPHSLCIGRPHSRVTASQKRSTEKISGLSHDGSGEESVGLGRWEAG